ncbi:MAG: hypothetical protein JRF33_19015 [Deltaproteobacteria bacterium]|nr:hypothetical protein [Deltaproteobacteria bacterium]
MAKLAVLVFSFSLIACTFDPHPDLARYEACEDDGGCAVTGCSCLEKWWVCAPDDPKAKPEFCHFTEPSCDGVVCDDNNDCTDDSCEAGACVHTDDDTNDCDDDNPETIDACVAGVCHGTADPACVSDSDCGTTDNCNLNICVGGECVHEKLTGSREGPYGDPTCGNGLDDDCNGSIDTADTGCAPFAGACNSDLWCWENPLPTGNTINDFWFDGGDLWAVGDAGTILRWDGLTWESFSDSTHVDLNAVWGCDGHVWVFGDEGYIAHRFGESTFEHVLATTTDAGDLLDAWGRSCDDIWVVGSNGTVLGRQGANWAPLEGLMEFDAHLYAIWGDANSFWVAGDHFAGGAFLQRRVGTADWQNFLEDMPNELTSIRSLWVSPEGDVWLGGSSGIIAHRDGNGWEMMDTSTRQTILGIHAGSDGMVYAVDLKGTLWLLNGPNDGLQLLSDEAMVPMNALWSQGSDRVYLGGERGKLAVYDGLRLRQLSFGERSDLNAIHGWPLGAPWAVGMDGRILRREGPNNIWVDLDVGQGQMNLYGICMPQPGAGWIVGESETALWMDGSGGWQPNSIISNMDFFDVFGWGSERMLAVGSGGRIMEWQSEVEVFEEVYVPEPDADTLRAVHVYGDTEAMAVGDRGAIFRGDRSGGSWQWLQVDLVQEADWSDVAMLVGGMIWVVGQASGGESQVLLIGAGNVIDNSVIPPETLQPLNAVYGVNYNQVWIAGGSMVDSVLSLDQQAYVGYWSLGEGKWATQSPGCKTALTDIWDDGTYLYVVGRAGTILSRLLNP